MCPLWFIFTTLASHPSTIRASLPPICLVAKHQRAMAHTSCQLSSYTTLSQPLCTHMSVPYPSLNPQVPPRPGPSPLSVPRPVGGLQSTCPRCPDVMPREPDATASRSRLCASNGCLGAYGALSASPRLRDPTGRVSAPLSRPDSPAAEASARPRATHGRHHGTATYPECPWYLDAWRLARGRYAVGQPSHPS